MRHQFLSVRKICCILVCLVVLIPAAAQRKREMRAAWIATVVGIDWPPSVDDVTAQRQRMIEILDSLKALNFNAVVFQARPTADAFYQSDIEPWSRYLTGRQGVPPEPFYDPLAFVVREAHRRCMEVHVWLNPYRAILKGGLSQLDSTHIYFQHPEWFVTYGEQLLFNPALPETREYLNRVVADIVTRYDIDAVHFDDYFYPYRYKGQEFPDDKEFRANPRGFVDKGDWRRDNVNLVIAQLQHTIKSIKPWVEFGISPFGVWRNASKDERGSQTRAMSNYDDLYADILLWLERGDIDYVVPQLYWEIGHSSADFATLVDWWSRHACNRNYYVGLYASNLGNATAKPVWRTGNEVMRQLRYMEQVPQQGAMFYSTVALMQNRQGICDSLRRYYRYPALVPQQTGVNGSESMPVKRLRIVRAQRCYHLEWDAAHESDGCAPAYYVVYAFPGNDLGDFDDPRHILTITADNCVNLTDYADKLRGHYKFAVTVVNRYGQESAPAMVQKHKRGMR